MTFQEKPHDERAVLIVEDNEADLQYLLSAFKQEEFAHPLIVVRDGVEALDYLCGIGKYVGRDKGRTPALILLDLRLPKIDGLEVLRRIRADRWLKYIVVAILTTSKVEQDKIESKKLGINMFMHKPINPKDFMQIAKQVKSLLGP